MSRLVFHECLGRGGFGEVYRATWTRRELENQVAVKLLNTSVRSGSDAAKRLRDEARLLGALTHPGILRVYDLVEIEGSMAMIAEYVHGEDLDRCVLAGLPTAGLLEVIARVSSALAAAWGDISPITGKPLRLVHRDIKPENIRLSPEGNPKLLDFGVARAVELKRHAETDVNTVMGSYRYMSPERFDQGCKPHPSIDVFALGCILFEGLAFKRLFGDLSMRQMMMLSVAGSPRLEQHIEAHLEQLPLDTDKEIIELIRRLTNRDPDLRPLPGRLAAMCDDLAEQLPGTTLRQWARGRQWVPGKHGDGAWTGRAVELGALQDDDEGSGFPLDADGLTQDLPDEDRPTSESGLRDVSSLGAATAPRMAPAGLHFADPEPTAAESDWDAGADTVAIQRDQLRPQQPDEGDEATEPGPLAEPAPKPTSGSERPVPRPDPSRPEPPAGPEVYKKQQEALEARQRTDEDAPMLAGQGAVIANLVALGVLVLLGVVGLLLAVLLVG